MAKITKTMLGKISGSIGNLTVRQTHGKAFIINKPASYTIPNDAVSIRCRNAFGFACKLASVINAISQVQPFWQNAAPKNSTAFHTIMKINYRNVTVDSVTENTTLTPSIGFNLCLDSQLFTPATLQITTKPIGTTIGIDTVLETQLQLIAVISMSNPAGPAVKPNHLSSLVSAIQPLVLDVPLKFSLSLDNIQSQQFVHYNTHQALLALVTLKDNNTPVQYSATVLVKN
jgi:hypothetical protein